MTKTICLEYGYYKSSAKLFQSNNHDAIPLYVDKNCYQIQTQILLTNAQVQKLKGHELLDYEFLNTLGEMKIGDEFSEDEHSYIFSKFRLPPEYFDTLCSKSDAIIVENHITRSMIMACYVYVLINNILKYNPNYLTDRREIKILIGSLNDCHWGKDDAVEKYKTLVKKATGVLDVQIILM